MSAKDIEIHIISYEKIPHYNENKKCLHSVFENSNLFWHPLTYTKYPLVISTLFDLAKGFFLSYYLIRKHRYSFLHCRSQIPAIVGLLMKKLMKIQFIFDMRGWWIEEKMESGHWKNSLFLPIVKFLKWTEKLSLNNCDQMIVLTHASEKILLNMYPDLKNRLTVIPTCVSINSFGEFDSLARNQIRFRLGILEDAKVLIYSGSLGGNYSVKTGIDIFTFFLKLFPGGHVIILSKTEPQIITEKLNSSIVRQDRIHIFEVNYSQVNKYLSAGDLGLILYSDSWSNIGRSPTKLAEYWLCGLPVLAPKNIGDLEMLKSRYPFGLEFFHGNNSGSINDSMTRLSLQNHRQELRKAATKYFGMKKGVDLYRMVYGRLLNDFKYPL